MLPDKCSSQAGGINGHGPPLLGREINRGWRSRFTLQFSIWMRKVGELARFKRGSLRYNSNFLCLEYEGIDNVGFIPLQLVAYNSNHATRLERVGGGTILTRYADYLVAQVWYSNRKGHLHGTILNRGTILAFSCLEHEGVDNVGFLPPYNST